MIGLAAGLIALAVVSYLIFTDADLTRVLEQAPWITAQSRTALSTHLHDLERTASSEAATTPFAADVDSLATEIDTTFGISPAS